MNPSGYDDALRSIVDNPAGLSASDRLHQLLDVQWAYDVAEFPEFAYAVGEPQPGAGWTDLSTDAIERRHRQVARRLEAIESIDGDGLDADDELNHQLFLRESRVQADGLRFASHLLPVGQLNGPQQEVPLSISDMPLQTVDHFEALITRLGAVPDLVGQTIDLLAEGLATGITPPRVTVEGVPAQIDELVTDEAVQSGLAGPLQRFPSTVPVEDHDRLRVAAESVLVDAVFPAYRRLRDFLADTYVPGCRKTIAITDLADGDAWYAWRIREQTSTDLDAETIHATGHAELERIGAEMAAVVEKTGFAGSGDEFLVHVQTDPRFIPKTSEGVISAYRALCKRIDPELPRLFGTLPWLPYGVSPMPAHIEKTAPAAYYLPGSTAARRPGFFMANTYELDQRPTWEMVPLALHEAVPGHHFQFAIAQQLDHLHPWRRHLNQTAYIEGWGLYAEGLGHDMGLYDDPYDHFGALVFEAWRAARLVVDTGIHAMGWTRQQAIDFMGERTGKPGHDVEVEVDRYIAWPGQALAYTLGMITLRQLRRSAATSLGENFDLRAFHDELLGHGPLPLDVLEQQVSKWIAGAGERLTV